MGDLESFSFITASYWMLFPAVVIIVFLSFLEQRKLRQDLCQGRPALITPLNFLDGFDNRAAYAMALGAAVNVTIDMIESPVRLIDWPPWAFVFYVHIQAIVSCVICYPLFASLTTRYRALGAVICLLYSIVLLSLTLMDMAGAVMRTSQSANKTSDDVNEDDNVQRNILHAYYILSELPYIFLYPVMIGYCFYILYRCYITRSHLNKHRASAAGPHHLAHVRWVLGKSRITPVGSSTANNNPSFIYQMKRSSRLRYFTNLPFFKYPTRITALAFVLLNIAYRIGVQCIYETASLIDFVEKLREILILFNLDDFQVHINVCSIVALVACILNSLVQVFMYLRNYRYDILRIYQGNKQFLPSPVESSQTILASNMTFAGYQVAFMLIGITLCYLTVFLVTLLPTSIIYYYIKMGKLDELVIKVLSLLSFPVVVLILFLLYVLISKRVLLQEKLKVTDKDPPLNINNRKLYEIINYYALFTVMAAGLFSWARRGLMAGFFGVINMGRLDRSVFPHELVKFDKGYNAYLSMLLVDNAHNNPSMRVFVHLLGNKTVPTLPRQDPSQGNPRGTDAFTSQSTRRCVRSFLNFLRRFMFGGINFEIQEDHVYGMSSGSVMAEQHGARRARTRWCLAYTLMNNPQLHSLRKSEMNLKQGSTQVSTHGSTRGSTHGCTQGSTHGSTQGSTQAGGTTGGTELEETPLSLQRDTTSLTWTSEADKKSSVYVFTDLNSLSTSPA